MSTEDRTDRAGRPFDVVVWGATGFTGRLVTEYLAGKEGVRLAMAGRSHAKLTAVRSEIAARVPGAARAELLVGDATDAASLGAITSQARVVCATVGPFAQHGEPIVAACVQSRTDYCDITGEPHFIRRIIDAHHESARAAGVRLVPTCGFDSIPSDLGTFVLAEHALTRAGRPLGEVRAYVTAAKGGMSGGTVASMLQLLDVAATDRSVRRVLGDPYGLSPDRANDLNTDGSDPLAPRWDEDAGGWAAPWIMAAINTRVVRRSNALFGHRYGKGFRYTESLLRRGRVAGGIQAGLMSAGMGAAIALLSASPAVRRFAGSKLPSSGQGPSRAEREAGFFKLRLYGVLEGDARPSLLARVDGKGDPGYAATARMLGESALCLASDEPQPGFEGGVLTPATALGMRLVDRLSQQDISFEVTSL
ncbi:MAG: saccharopine dehydrogenase NADP-binding domain-containing protein [Polyangiaceae bacterium]